MSKYTAIEPIQDINFLSADNSSVTVQASNTPSNLSSGASGIGVGRSPNKNAFFWRVSNSPYTFLNLSPNKKYDFQLCSRNGDGMKTNPCTKTKCSQCNTPTTPVVPHETRTSLDVAIGYKDGNPNCTEYAIAIFSTHTGDQWIQSDGSWGSGTVYQTSKNWGPYGTITVNGLQNNTTYKFRTYAKNQEGDVSGQSPWGQGTTLKLIPDAPDNPGAKSIYQTGITWTWNDNSDNENGFNVYTGPGGVAPGTVTYKVGQNRTSRKYFRLSPNTEYAFRVSAYNNGGESAITTDISRYTSIEDMTDLVFPSVSPNSISVQSANSHSNLTDDNSGLQFCNTTNNTSSAWRQNQNAWTSSGLTPNTKYDFTGQARNGDGACGQLCQKSKYTHAVPPASPNLSRITATSIDVTLGSDPNPGYTKYAIEVAGPVNGYLQKFGSIKNQPYYQKKSAWGRTVAGPLPSNSTFIFMPMAVNEEGVLASGNSAQATTLPPSPTPVPPGAPGVIDEDASSIDWEWSDNSSDEEGFVIYTGKGTGTPGNAYLAGPNTQHFNLTGLLPNTCYSMQACSWNSGGNSSKTTKISHFTDANTPLAPIVNEPDENSLHVTIGMSDENSTPTLYAIQVSPNVGGNSWVQSDGTVSSSADYNTSPTWGTTEVTGLAPSSTYSFSVIARNQQGRTTSFGPSASGATLAAGSPPNGAPSNPGADVITQNSIQWTWSDNSSNEGFFNVYAGEGENAPGSVTFTPAENSECVDHAGLSPNTQYAMQVSAENINGETAPSMNISRYTAIEDVTGIVFTNLTSGSIALKSSNTPSNLSLDSSGLRFTINTSPEQSSGWKQDNSSYTFNGLTPNTEYEFTAAARNGDGEMSEIFTGATLCTLAAVPQAPILSDPTDTTMDVTIDPYDGNSSPTEYAISVYPDICGAKWVQQNGLTASTPFYQGSSEWGAVTVSDLNPDTGYSFEVYSRNRDHIISGPGPAEEKWTIQQIPASPDNPDATGVTQHSMYWIWDDNSDNETGFRIYSAEGESAPTEMSYQTGENADYWEHDGLDPNSPCTMQVSSVNTGGESPKTAELTRYTAGEPVNSLQITGVTTHSISVKSSNTPSNLSMGNSGLLFTNEKKGTNSGWIKHNQKWESDFLAPNTKYVISGKSRNADGLETEKATETVYTLAYVPLAPRVIEYGVNSMVLEIDSEDGNPGYTLYAVCVDTEGEERRWVQEDGSLGSDPVFQTHLSWWKIRVTGLSGKTFYEFRCVAKNESGVETEPGELIQRRTLSAEPTSVDQVWWRYN